MCTGACRDQKREPCNLMEFRVNKTVVSHQVQAWYWTRCSPRAIPAAPGEVVKEEQVERWVGARNMTTQGSGQTKGSGTQENGHLDLEKGLPLSFRENSPKRLQCPKAPDFSPSHSYILPRWALFTEWVLAPEFTESFWASLDAAGKHEPLLESGWLLQRRQVVTVFPWPSEAKDNQISRKQMLSGTSWVTRFQPRILSFSVADWTSQVRTASILNTLMGIFKIRLFKHVALKLFLKRVLI